MKLPKSLAVKPTILQIDSPGNCLLLSDIHIPHHDEETVNLAFQAAKKRRVSVIILNGDILDSGQISRHERHSSTIKYRDEISMGIEFLEYIRHLFPKARIIYKEGNHENRLDRYIMSKADALDGLEGINLQTFLKMKDFGVEWIDDSRIIKIGKLPVVHGHEFGGGGGGVNPARWLYLQAGECGIMGHFHRTSENHERDILGYDAATWSVGCACDLSPHWKMLNKWNHGFAIVELERGGGFHVSNRRVLSGKVV